MSKPLMVLVACCIATLFSNSAEAQRSFAPGVTKLIKPEINGRDVHSLPMSLPGVSQDYIDGARQTQWHFIDDTQTLLGQTRSVVFHRDVWQHEIMFLGLRQLNVTARNLDGQLRDRNIWYLVYRVRNVGASISHEAVEDQKFGHTDYEPRTDAETLDNVVMNDRFFGTFQLSGWVQDPETGIYSEETYSDRVSPTLTQIIQTEEDPDRPLFDKVKIAQMALERVPADTDEGGVWGVAVWYNVDPLLDFVSVKINGLTNAYRIEINPDKSIGFKNKTLQLNYWRPGDGIDQADDPIVHGIPLSDDPLKQIEVARRYHLPGPVIRGEIVDAETLRSTLIFETDAQLDTIDFDSAVAASLDTGQIPESVATAFTNAGFNLGANASLNTTIPGKQWTVTDTVDGQTRTFVVKLQPEFWEKSIDGGIRFIKSLDHLWVYE